MLWGYVIAYNYIYIYVFCVSKVKLATFVAGDLKAPFSIATTSRCRDRRYSIPRIASLCPWYLPYNAVLSKAASSTIFWVFGMTLPGIEPWSPGPLANTLLIRPMTQLFLISLFFHTVLWIWIFFEYIYLFHRWDPNICYHSGSGWAWE